MQRGIGAGAARLQARIGAGAARLHARIREARAHPKAHLLEPDKRVVFALALFPVAAVGALDACGGYLAKARDGIPGHETPAGCGRLIPGADILIELGPVDRIAYQVLLGVGSVVVVPLAGRPLLRVEFVAALLPLGNRARIALIGLPPGPFRFRFCVGLHDPGLRASAFEPCSPRES